MQSQLAPHWSWSSALMVVYALVVLGMILRLAYGLLCLRRLHKGAADASPALHELFDECRAMNVPLEGFPTYG